MHIFVFWEENRCLIIYINYVKSKAFTVTRHLATDMNEEVNWLIMFLATALPDHVATVMNLSVSIFIINTIFSWTYLSGLSSPSVGF